MPMPAFARSATSAISPTTACETLRLVLDAMAIAPLGDAVQIERVNVDVTATPGWASGCRRCCVRSRVRSKARPRQPKWSPR